jgi:anaerobic dimethyl sulfoxide reductase subunit A
MFCGKDCGGDACPLLAEVENGRVTRIKNNPAAGKYLKGCWRGFHLAEETHAADRILEPLVRCGPRGSGQFRPASWDEALDLTAQKLNGIRARYGAEAVMAMPSAGSTGALHATWRPLMRFLGLFGGCTRLTGSYSNGAAGFVLSYLLGSGYSESGFDAATLQDSEMIVLWGANVLETRLGCEVPQRVLEAKQRGAQVVVIDPRRSATVEHASTWWIPVQPGTDAALMLAVLHVLISENLVDRNFIAGHTAGFGTLQAYVLGQAGSPACTPGWAESVCGTPAEEIVRFARAYAAAKPAALLPGYSIQRVTGGEETFRLTVALQAATGNFGVRGGSTGSINSRLPAPRVGVLEFPDPAAFPSVPELRWPDVILQGKAGGYPVDIHAVYTLGANLVNQGADIRKNQAAFEKLDFAVTHAIFMTPTTLLCDVIFPAATALEKEDIGIPWLGNYLLYKPAVESPAGQARSDYDALWALAERLGFGDPFSEGRTAADWIDHFIAHSEIPDPEEFKRTGIYLAPDQERVGLSRFHDDPEGCPLDTPSGRIEIASETYARDTGFPAIPTWREPPHDPRYPLRLITPKSPYRTHSQGSNLPVVREKANHALEMHPSDAAARGIADGDRVRVCSAQGQTYVKVRLSENLTPGVVCLPEGVWVEWDPNGSDVAGSANVLTSTEGTSPSISAVMHAVGVQVERENS